MTHMFDPIFTHIHTRCSYLLVLVSVSTRVTLQENGVPDKLEVGGKLGGVGTLTSTRKSSRNAQVTRYYIPTPLTPPTYSMQHVHMTTHVICITNILPYFLE